MKSVEQTLFKTSLSNLETYAIGTSADIWVIERYTHFELVVPEKMVPIGYANTIGQIVWSRETEHSVDCSHNALFERC